MNTLQNYSTQTPQNEVNVDITSFLDGFRERVGLPPKGEYVSNFKLETKALEISHICRLEFDEIFNELLDKTSTEVTIKH